MVVEAENVRLQLGFLALKGKGDARDMNSNPHPSIRHDPASPALVSQTSYAPKMEPLTLLEQSMEAIASYVTFTQRITLESKTFTAANYRVTICQGNLFSFLW